MTVVVAPASFDRTGPVGERVDVVDAVVKYNIAGWLPQDGLFCWSGIAGSSNERNHIAAQYGCS